MTTIVYPADERNPTVGFMETTISNNEEELIEALHLITDSIAQQRQIAASSIMHHPLYFLFLVIMAEYLWRSLYFSQHDLIMVAITWLVGVAVSMHFVKMVTSKYLDEAERVGTWTWLFGARWVQYFGDGSQTNESLFWVLWNRVWVRVPGGDPEVWKERTRLLMNWNWPDSSSSSASSASSSSSGSSSGSASTSASSSSSETDGDDDNAARWDRYRQQQQRQRQIEDDFEAHSIPHGWLRDWIFVSKFQGKVIAALVMRVLPVGQNTVPAPGPGARQGTLRNRAVIRAWTVKQEFRGYGLGMEVLGFAIEVAKSHGWEGPVFAGDHANSKRLWLGLFNERMNWMDRRARALLAREIRARGFEIPAAQTA